jgi:hypothetical protein
MTEHAMNRTLWIVQWLLALLFLFAGGISLPSAFLRFIGVAEMLGGVGLICRGCFASGKA